MQTAPHKGVWPYEAKRENVALKANNFAPFPKRGAKKGPQNLFTDSILPPAKGAA